MALTPTQRIELGTQAPPFELTDTVSGEVLSLNTLKGEIGTLIMFICNHCPYVKHINKTIVALAKTYQHKGIKFIAISSNDILCYPQDAPQYMKQVALEEHYSFPYLFDETQQVAKDYGAVCTPDIFLFDGELNLYYHGQIDDSRPSNIVISDGIDLITAFEKLLQGQSPPMPQKTGVGCNIKWK